MDSLTTDQRKKIEENKRLALLKKDKQNVTLKTVHPPPSSSSTMWTKRITTNTKQAINFQNTVSTPIVAAIQLFDKDRFVINMNFHSPTIEMFKTISGRLYDAHSKRWTFPLSQYETLIKNLSALKPSVSISRMPNVILQTFAKPFKENTDDTDLSKIDEPLLNTLMPFQREGVRFGISRNGRCLIADDMGLGKTIQALGIAHFYKENWPLLIVCPSSMRFPWEEAIQNFLPSINPFYITVITTSKDFISEAQVVICSYDLLKSCLEALLRKMFGVIILDESHFLKSPKSARTKATLQLTQKCKRVVLLSGTPALSRPQELYSQIFAIDPTAFRTFHDFGMRYCDGKKSKFGWDFTGSSNMEELELFLKRRIMIRRLKSEVIKQLPSKMRKVVVLHPNMVNSISKQMNEYATKLENQKGRERRGTLLTYYCATGSAKLNAVCEYIEDKLECQNKFLVFAHHTHVLNGISELLMKHNVDYIRIDGSTQADSRKVYCDRFQTDEKCRVAVLSIKAANSGITLTAAQLVIFAELFWNPGELTQAEDRVHRIGQNDSVVVEYLIAKGTADEQLWNLLQSKLTVLNKVGLSKDNFKETDTEHLAARGQQTLTEMFQTLQGQKEPPDETAADGSETLLELEDDDMFVNLDLDEIENDYQVESKKRKTK